MSYDREREMFDAKCGDCGNDCQIPFKPKEDRPVPDLVDETIDQERCLMQNVGTVEMIVKYHSNQKKTDLYTAENVSKITDNRNLF
jgi:CxxC-x17-CxxC domain-containing protein